MILIKNVGKKFGRLQALDNINLEFPTSRGIALIGPNGSGKTTLIKCILGMVFPDKGEIYIEGKPVGFDGSYRRNIGYMPQLNKFPENMSIGNLFGLLSGLRKDIPEKKMDHELIEEFRLYDIYHKKLGILSGGTRQKVSAALAFLFNPSILILDEPTAGLDPFSNELLKSKILKTTKAGKTVLITSHNMSDLDDITTDVVYLLNGKVWFYNSVEQLKAETSETRLNKIIAQIIYRNEPIVYT